MGSVPENLGDERTSERGSGGKDILTNSSLATLRQCPRKYYYRYECGFAASEEAHYLRMGSAFHKGIEVFQKTKDPAVALGEALATLPDDLERETIKALLEGHFWRYADDEPPIESEVTFEMPVVNPGTLAASRTFVLRGKIDELHADRIGELKTVNESIEPESDYWLRLRADAQVSIYILAARHRGHDVSECVYDATRKPAIAPKQIPLLDDAGFKIVLDSDGNRVFNKNGSPRQTGGDGMELQTRLETPAEFGARLLADLGERPDFYFQRRIVTRTDDELIETQLEIWQQAKQLLEMRRHGRWFRNVTRSCANCEFMGVCLNNVKVDPANPPSGLVVLNNVHPELGEVYYVNRNVNGGNDGSNGCTASATSSADNAAGRDATDAAASNGCTAAV